MKISGKEKTEKYQVYAEEFYDTEEVLETWYRPDMMLFIERWVLEKGKVVDKFRILPNTNDINKIGHIDFTKHYYEDFKNAVKAMTEINITQ